MTTTLNDDMSTQLNVTNVLSRSTLSILINNGTSRIYNATLNTSVFNISGKIEFTFDSYQCLYGDGTGLLHIKYSNIDHKPNNV